MSYRAVVTGVRRPGRRPKARRAGVVDERVMRRGLVFVSAAGRAGAPLEMGDAGLVRRISYRSSPA
jgi:hypothetical protein